MRYLQIVTVIILLLSLVFAGWVNYRYYGNLNTDYPTITNSIEQLEVSVEDPAQALLQGLQASDATDGDLTDQILIASVSHFLEPGTVNIKYVVFDRHNNSATLTRRVHYTDYTPPQFSLSKAPSYIVGKPCDVRNYIQVTDAIDGDISDRVRVISNMVNTYSVGNYPMVLEVTNSCGDVAQLTIWVDYRSQHSSAAISLHQYIVYTQQGEAFEPRQYIAAVTDRNLKALNMDKVEVLGNLDINTPGSYQLVYSYNDGKLSGQTPLTVVVTER